MGSPFIWRADVRNQLDSRYERHGNVMKKIFAMRNGARVASAVMTPYMFERSLILAQSHCLCKKYFLFA
ncbi:hypothetical protein HPP92_007904 [Vanilla planifolia]|uniref:Uncharacterized protein n=1 Tax=Vanilla planifolia TaxID=51239 RepID=A0A835RLE4_VANPL|nr:hypothetical protein HPP92_007904 [Vanilla planifolia]